MWDVAERKHLHDLRVGDSFRFLAFSPDDRLLAGADWANAAFLWEVASGTRLAPPLRHDGMVAHVAFSSRGDWLATSSVDGTVKLWDLQSRTLIQSLSHRDFPMQTSFNTDDSALLTRTFSGWVHLWDPRTGKPAASPIRHSSWVTAAELHPDGRRLLTACADGSVRVWDLHPNGALFWPWQGQAQRVLAASGAGRFVITENSQFQVQTWDPGSWSSNRISVQATGPVSAAFLKENGQRLLLVEPGHDRADLNQRASLWDCQRGTVLWQFKIPAPANGPMADVFAAAPDCRRLALGRNREVEIWDVSAGRRLNKPNNHSTTVSVLRFSPDGSRLLVNCGRLVHVLDSASGREVFPPLTNTLATSAAEFSPDGTLIATAGSDVSYNAGEARLWDTDTGRLLRRIMHPDGVPAVAFSSDSHWLATGCENKTARVWDVRTGAPVTPRLRHSEQVIGLAFSPDSRLLASVSRDGAVCVWDTLSGEAIIPPLGLGNHASHVRFLSDSRYLLTDEQGGQFWRLEPIGLPTEDLLNLAQLFANHRVDLTGALEPLSLPEQARLFSALHARYPESFCLNAAHAKRPTALESPRRWNSLGKVPPRTPGATADLIDLTPYYTAGLVGNWHADHPQNDLASLPTGVQTFAGTEFDVRGLAQLSSRTSASAGLDFPSAIKGIELNCRCRKVHFLHSALWGFDREGTRIGKYVFHYRGGGQDELPILLGEDVLDWWAKPEQDRTNRLVVAWSGSNGKSLDQGKTIRLYKSTWVNPRPEIEIEKLDFISELKQSAPFLIAITTEP